MMMIHFIHISIAETSQNTITVRMNGLDLIPIVGRTTNGNVIVVMLHLMHQCTAHIRAQFEFTIFLF